VVNRATVVTHDNPRTISNGRLHMLSGELLWFYLGSRSAREDCWCMYQGAANINDEDEDKDVERVGGYKF
jgi:hypothetical protein